jgi:hypothetical protein
MKRIILSAGFVLLAYTVIAQQSLMVKTETHYWDSTNTYNGYTLFAAQGTSYLIDMEGHLIHTWPVGSNPRFTEAGTLLDAVGSNPANQNTFKELNWNGNVVWQYTESRTKYHCHDDFVKIYNPKLGDSTLLYIANKDLTSAECLAKGCDASQTYTNPQMDAIVEVDLQGNVIWEWCFFDHVVQSMYSSITSTYGVIANTPGKINLNMPGYPVQNDWLHCNSIDYNQALDQVVINSVHGEFYVIDHGNTFVPNDSASSIALAASSTGDFLYRFGDPCKYNQGTAPSVAPNWEKCSAGHKQLGASDNIQWIKTGLTGAGHFLVFNNDQNLCEPTSQSYIYEINPFLNSSGTTTSNYINPPTAGYTNVSTPNSNLMKEKKNQSKQITWKYSSKNNTTFYSTAGSSAQRLPNGNTFICSSNDGHLFEIANDTVLVWEYFNPVTSNGIKKIKVDNYPKYNFVHRAYRYTSSHSALAGQNLTAGNTLTGDIPDYFTPADLTKKSNKKIK